jgi:hypothetical protein
MEPVFMICGESSGIAACRALAENASVQEIDLAVYRAALETAGQKLAWDVEKDVSTAGGGLTMGRLLRECDRDGDALVSQAEWTAAKKGWDWLFPRIDTDGNGQIDAKEYAAFQDYKAKHPDWQKRRD